MTAPLINDLRANVERAIRDTAQAQGLSPERITAIVEALRRDGTIAKAAEKVRGTVSTVLRAHVNQSAGWLVAAAVVRTERLNRKAS